jgi:hypothetical protein
MLNHMIRIAHRCWDSLGEIHDAVQGLLQTRSAAILSIDQFAFRNRLSDTCEDEPSMKHTLVALQPGSAQVGTPGWIDGEVERFLLTGTYDVFFAGWPGSDCVDAAVQGTQRLRCALIAETFRRAEGLQFSTFVPNDLYGWSSNKLKPMVNGLLKGRERTVVLHLLASNIVFLTPANVARALESERWLSTAWDVANIYLESLNVPALSAQASNIVGLSQETTCYVSMAYFKETDPFADFVVHEAAHVFHNGRRSTAGLSEKPHGDYLLDIDYRMRETFAWACEAWSQICCLAPDPGGRKALLRQHVDFGLPSDDRVNHDEYLEILRGAIRARNGWQHILARCTTKPQASRKSAGTPPAADHIHSNRAS